jgi:hypothetical protein
MSSKRSAKIKTARAQKFGKRNTSTMLNPAIYVNGLAPMPRNQLNGLLFVCINAEFFAPVSGIRTHNLPKGQ